MPEYTATYWSCPDFGAPQCG